MSETIPTIKEILDPAINYARLRRVVGQLEPQPWLHDWQIVQPMYIGTPNQQWYCSKCKIEHRGRRADLPKIPCPISNPATDSLADITEALVKMIPPHTLEFTKTVIKAAHSLNIWPKNDVAAWTWFSIYATPAERCACCLLALLPEKVSVGK